MKDFLQKSLNIFFLIALIIGGLGGQNFILLNLILLWFTVSFTVLAVKKKSLNLPGGFYLYLTFLILFAINLFWTKDFWNTFWYLLVFTAGLFFWIISYNFKNELKNFDRIILCVGIFFGILTIVNFFIHSSPASDSYSLHKFATKNHHHIGDLWATVLSVLTIKILSNKKNRWIWIILVLVGTYFLYISQSRTAVLALVFGCFYILQSYPSARKFRSFFYVLIFSALFLFLLFARSKTTFFDRVYYLQGIAGVIKHPLGVGVGNFGLMSQDPDNQLFGLSEYSSVAMNIVLEMFAGMGIFAFIFLLWIIKAVLSVLQNSAENSLIPRIVFLTLTVNFMFNFAYLIPTMLWLWFISLGLSTD